MSHIQRDDGRVCYLQSVIDASHEAMFVTEKCRIGNAGHRILFVNTPFSEQTGFSSAEAIGRPPTFLFGPAPAIAALDRFAEAFDRHQRTQIDLLSHRKDGSAFQAELTISPMVVDGRCDHAVAVQRADAPVRPAADPARTMPGEFGNMADSLGEAILIHRDMEPLFANAAYLDLLGYESLSEALQEKGPLFNLTAETRLRLRNARANATSLMRRRNTFRYQAVRTDGRTVRLFARCHRVDWPGGPATLMSITPERQPQTRRIKTIARQPAERAAPAAANQAPVLDGSLIERLVDSVPMMVAYKDRNLVYQYANQLFSDWVGLPRESIIGRHVSEIRNESHYQMMKPRRADVFAGKTLRYDTTRDVPGLGLRNLAVLLVPHRNQTGTVEGYFTLVNDVTELKDIEKALAQRESQLNLIIDSVPALITYRDRNLCYRYVNKTFEEWYGLPPDQVIGQRMTDILSVSTFARVKPYLDRVLAGEGVQYEIETRYPEIGDRRVLVNFVPHKDETGGVVGFFTISQIMAPGGNGDGIVERLQSATPG